MNITDIPMNITDIPITTTLSFFSSIGIITVGYIISAVAVSYLTYQPNYYDDDDNDDDDDDDEYENNIYNEFLKLKIVDLSDDYIKSLKYKYSREMTLDGELIVCYNNDTETFNYWSDTKNIYFKTLELATQKYVTNFNCKKLYHLQADDIEKSGDKQETGENKQESGENKQETGENKQETGEKQIFAKLQKYNKNNKNNKNNTTQVIKNRYSYRGKINDFDTIISNKFNKNKNDIDRVNNISFKNFKNKTT